MTTMQSWVIPADVNQCQFTDLLLGGPYGGYIADANSGLTQLCMVVMNDRMA